MRSLADIAVQSCLILSFILAIDGIIFDYKKLLFKRRPQSISFGSSRRYEAVGTKLTEYKFENCGNASVENFIVTKLVFSPDPLVFPGDFNVSFEAELKKNVSINLKAAVQLSERVDNQDVPIPCEGNIGSCVYDLCNVLKDVECPQTFKDAKVPCRCPFEAVNYSLPLATFKVYADFLLPAVYTFTVNLTHSDDVYLGCYKLVATFACKF